MDALARDSCPDSRVARSPRLLCAVGVVQTCLLFRSMLALLHARADSGLQPPPLAMAIDHGIGRLDVVLALLAEDKTFARSCLE